MTSKRHPLSERFHQLLAKCGELHDRKQADYGRDDDPFANVRSSGDFGVPGWVGAMVRGNDKMKRIQKAAKQVVGGDDIELENESMENSLFDLAVYSLIAYVLFEEENGLLPADLFEEDEPVGMLRTRYRIPVGMNPHDPVSPGFFPIDFPLQWKDEIDDIWKAIKFLQLRNYHAPEFLFLPARDWAEGRPLPASAIFGIPLGIDRSLEADEFVMRSITKGQMVEFHHFRFSVKS